MLNHLLCISMILVLVYGDIPAQNAINVEVNSMGEQASIDTDSHHLNIRRPTREPTAVGIKIKNGRNEELDYFWWNGREGQLQGKLHRRGVTATNSYEGHIFYVTPRNKPSEELYRFEVNSNENLYLVPPSQKEIEYDEEALTHWNKLLEEKQFMQNYKQRTGRPWLAHYPRDPPILPMWPAEYIGQKHKIISNQSYWICIPNDINNKTQILNCRPNKSIEFIIEVLNLEPKVYRINNTLSDIESNLIINLSKPKIKRSLAGQDGGMISTTRTSHNTWLNRNEHIILNTIYHRTADILNLDSNILHTNKNVESLQVLNYQIGQEYTSHHDFGANGRPNQRFITLLFYLNNQLNINAGGETAFPKAKRNNSNKLFSIHPGKGNSILFYSMLEDGNADDLSLHAALPVKEGEKWLCNFWVWDPYR